MPEAVEAERRGSRTRAGEPAPSCCPLYHEAVEMSGRIRLATLSSALVLAAGLAALLLAVAGSGRTASRTARNVERCRPGTVLAEGPLAPGRDGHGDGHGDGGARACVLMGQPETF